MGIPQNTIYGGFMRKYATHIGVAEPAVAHADFGQSMGVYAKYLT
jgi:hypothetical protein